MDYNRLGHSGLRVPALSFGTGTFGGGNDFWNLVPVERQTHWDLFNSFWGQFNGL